MTGPFAREVLARAARNGQAVMLSMDQADLGDRMAVLMAGLRVGARALPLAWLAEGAKVLLSARRFNPSLALFAWLGGHGWGCRLKGSMQPEPSHGGETTVGGLARGGAPPAGGRLFAQGP